MWQRLQPSLNKPIAGQSLAAFRVVFGLLAVIGGARFLASGWVDQFFGKPTFFFKFLGAHWVSVAPPWAMNLCIWAIIVLGICITLGLFYRLSTVLFFLVFSYVELTDVTNYLNHYYQVSLLALLLCILPLHRTFSLDVWRKPTLRVQHFPAWMVLLLRFQVGVVYVFAAIAKLNADWLLHAQPLNIWLLARTDTPLIGWMLGSFEMAMAMSWIGFLHDLLIVPALLWRRTRVLAYGVLVVFHVATGLLFNIGMFPWIMIVTATIFFPPDWPKAFWQRIRRRDGKSLDNEPDSSQQPTPMPLARWGAVLTSIWCFFHIAFPLRCMAYPGPVLWHEQGMRFAWNVMVREKTGSVTYKVKHAERTREQLVVPNQYLTPYQEKEMATQPDLILQLAHHIAQDYRDQGYTDVEVRVDAIASLNGRRSAPLIDPTVDLTQIEDGFARAHWILPAPTTDPIRLKPATKL